MLFVIILAVIQQGLFDREPQQAWDVRKFDFLHYSPRAELSRYIASVIGG